MKSDPTAQHAPSHKSMVDLPSRSPLWIDAQASGASPKSGGVLLELAWQGEGAEAQQAILKPPPGFRLAKRIQMITGLQRSTLARGEAPAKVAEALWATLRERERPLFVAHYVRFERPFVLALLRAHSEDDASAAQLEEIPWLCLHELGRRLLPDLPRASLRALAGYFGHHLPETRRSGPQLAATVTLYTALLGELEREGISGPEEARIWCASSPRRRGRSKPPLDPLARLSLESCPGIYRLLSRESQTLYIGMARDLKRRVNQHFRGKKGREERHLEMISQVFSVEVEGYASTLAAALRESAEIKRCRPIYNRSLLGEQRLRFYDVETLTALSEDAPEATRQAAFGPFLDETLAEVIRRLIGWRRGLGGAALGPFEPFETGEQARGLDELEQHLGSPARPLSKQLRESLRIIESGGTIADPFASLAITLLAAFERAQRRAALIERLATIELRWLKPSAGCLPLRSDLSGVELRVRDGALVSERPLDIDEQDTRLESNAPLPSAAQRCADRIAYDGGRIIFNQLLRARPDELLWIRPPRGRWRRRATLDESLELLRAPASLFTEEDEG